jgi:hypothetical protein
VISCNYFIFTGFKYDNCRTVSQRKQPRKRLKQQNVAGAAVIGFLACFSSLLLLVLLLSEDVSAVNLRRPCLDVATAQTPDGMQSLTNSQLT